MHSLLHLLVLLIITMLTLLPSSLSQPTHHNSTPDQSVLALLNRSITRSHSLGFPAPTLNASLTSLQHSPEVRSYLKRCDFLQIECHVLDSASSKEELEDLILSLLPSTHYDPDPINQRLLEPFILTNCDKSLGFSNADLTIDAILEVYESKLIAESETISTPAVAYHQKSKYATSKARLADVLSSNGTGYYFNAHSGELWDNLNRSYGDCDTPLFEVLSGSDRLFGGVFVDKVDSFQMYKGADGGFILSNSSSAHEHEHEKFGLSHSVVSHDHTLSTLYLLNGIKIWFATAFEDEAPPPITQWSNPLNSWFPHIPPNWHPKVCAQQAGDVVVLPNFYRHATVSLDVGGGVVSFGLQKPFLDNKPKHYKNDDNDKYEGGGINTLPLAIQNIWTNSHDVDKKKEAYWKLAKTNKWDLKLLKVLNKLYAGYSSDANNNNEGFKMLREWVLTIIDKVYSMRDDGVISGVDCDIVVYAVEGVGGIGRWWENEVGGEAVVGIEIDDDEGFMEELEDEVEVEGIERGVEEGISEVGSEL